MDIKGDDISCSDSSSSEAPEIGLDQYGRIAPGPIGKADYSFRVISECISSQFESFKSSIENDCCTVFSARDIEDGEAYSSGQTYFIRANETPECALEKLALDIFGFHAEGLSYDASTSGAEWWTLVMDPNDGNVAVHWDKDYGYEDYCVNVFPQISTVTYLSDVGGPTCVVDKLAPPLTTEDVSGPAQSCFLSKPRFGKHISFDGRFLHFASDDLKCVFPKDYANCSSSKNLIQTVDGEEQRVTFLVNVWFNHVPLDADRIPENTRRKLSSLGSFHWSSKKRIDEVFEVKCSSSTEISEIKVYEMSDDYQIRFGIPKISASDSVTVHFGEDVSPFVHKSSNKICSK